MSIQKISDPAVVEKHKAGKILKKTKELAVKVADRNGDGMLDRKDVSAAIDTVKDSAKAAAQSAMGAMERRAREKELNALRPIFAEDIDSTDFFLSKLIRVAEPDKKHTESELCCGSVGYETEQDGFRLATVYPFAVDNFGIKLEPDNESEFYYVDPTDRDRYIAADEYFHIMQIARANELQRIAQSLGAKCFKVTLVQRETISEEKKAEAGVGKKPKAAKSRKKDEEKESALPEGGIEADRGTKETSYREIKTMAKNEFVGHAPIRPRLRYLQGDPTVENLIEMRMNTISPLKNQTYHIDLVRTSGIKLKDAIKIDAVLQGMKYDLGVSFASEAKKEETLHFAYEIIC